MHIMQLLIIMQLFRNASLGKITCTTDGSLLPSRFRLGCVRLRLLIFFFCMKSELPSTCLAWLTVRRLKTNFGLFFFPSRILAAVEDLTKRVDTNTTEAYTLQLTNVAVYANNVGLSVTNNGTGGLNYFVPFESGRIQQNSSVFTNTTLFSLPRSVCKENPHVCDKATLPLRMVAFFTDTLFQSSRRVRGSVASIVLGDGSPLNLTHPLVFFQPQQVRLAIMASVQDEVWWNV